MERGGSTLGTVLFSTPSLQIPTTAYDHYELGASSIFQRVEYNPSLDRSRESQNPKEKAFPVCTILILLANV